MGGFYQQHRGMLANLGMVYTDNQPPRAEHLNHEQQLTDPETIWFRAYGSIGK